MSPYGGKSIAGAVGSSFEFKWSFSAGVRKIEWGIKRSGRNLFELNGVLVSVDALGNVVLSGPSGYAGRVNGTADYSTGHAIFVLRNVTKGDERSYGAQIIPLSGGDLSQFDPVNLILIGTYPILNPAITSSNKVKLYINWVANQLEGWHPEGPHT